MGYNGLTYTWPNCCNSKNLILERTDRAFCNPSWRILFLEASISHLPRILLDHCPISVNLFEQLVLLLEKPFHFKTYWLSHPNFHNSVDFV